MTRSQTRAGQDKPGHAQPLPMLPHGKGCPPVFHCTVCVSSNTSTRQQPAHTATHRNVQWGVAKGVGHVPSQQSSPGCHANRPMDLQGRLHVMPACPQTKKCGGGGDFSGSSAPPLHRGLCVFNVFFGGEGITHSYTQLSQSDKPHCMQPTQVVHLPNEKVGSLCQKVYPPGLVAPTPDMPGRILPCPRRCWCTRTLEQ